MAREAQLKLERPHLRPCWLKDRPQHHVGRAQRVEVDKGEGLWSTRYELVTSDGERVEFWLPGGCDMA